MAKYEQYAEYKDSGVEWLGGIPSHWEVLRLKQVIEYGSSVSYGIVQPGEALDEGIRFIQTTNISKGSFELNDFQKTSVSIESNYPRSRLKGGEVILGIRASIGAAFVVPDTFKGINLSRGIARIATNKFLTSEFLVWYFKSDAVEKYWGLSKQGSTFSEVSIETVKELYIPIPKTLDQTQIANFLDFETAQIDTLIEKQQTLIQLLKEKRQAVISHAVTKGLNPDAPMKDSGVEWLGEVPEHWDIVKLKRLVNFSQGVQVDLGLQKHEEFDRSVKFLRIENYTQGSSDYRFINPILSQGKLVNRDELVMVRYGASAGYVGSGLEGALANNLFKISPTTNTITNNFLSSFLKNSYNYFQKEMSGSAMPALNFSMVEDLIITLPPIYEQKNIADYLDEIQNHFDYLTACAEQAIQLMQERRTALISAAVTGKIDVRGWRVPD